MLAIYSFEDLRVVLRDFGSAIKFSSAVFLIGALSSLLLDKNAIEIFYYYIIAGLVAFFSGLICELIANTKKETELKHAFFIVSLIWILFPLFAALPFTLILDMHLLDSYFESVSALTTTGLSLMTIPSSANEVALLDLAPKSLIFWRSFISWIGGVGIVLIASIGVFAKYTRASKALIAEGHEERLKANLMNSAREILVIYAILTILGIIMLYLSGMDLFNAINYSMSAISTTGMTTSASGLSIQHNFWQNEGVRNYWTELSLVLIMIFGATSFYVHYLFKKGDKKAYFKDAEFLGLIVLGLLFSLAIFPHLGFESAAFHSYSAITCGGFALVLEKVVGMWPSFVKLMLIAAMFIGGSSGSTAGGIKVARFLLFLKSIYWKAKEVVLPKGAIFAKKFEGREVSEHELKELYLFILLYGLFIVIGTTVLVADGISFENAIFEVVSAQGNAGISTGITKLVMPASSKIILIINMLIGRLEIIPFFSLLALPLSLAKRKS